jgi:antitoxin YefM
MTEASYSYARDNLAKLWDEVEENREEIVLTRRGHEDMALLPAHELRTLKETAHLLRSPRNAARLLGALARSRGGGAALEVEAIAQLSAAVEM